MRAKLPLFRGGHVSDLAGILSPLAQQNHANASGVGHDHVEAEWIE